MLIETRTLSPQEMQDLVHRAHRLRAAALAAGFGRIVRRIVGVLRTLAETGAEALRRYRTYEELSRMTDRELRDIGLSRSDIPAVAAGIHHGRERGIGAAVRPRPDNDVVSVRATAGPDQRRAA